MWQRSRHCLKKNPGGSGIWLSGESVWFPAPHNPEMVVHVYSTSIWKTEEGASEIQGWLGWAVYVKLSKKKKKKKSGHLKKERNETDTSRLAKPASRGTVFTCRVWTCIALHRPLSSSALTIMKYREVFVRWEWPGKASPGASSVESPSVHCSLDFHGPSTLGIAAGRKNSRVSFISERTSSWP